MQDKRSDIEYENQYNENIRKTEYQPRPMGHREQKSKTQKGTALVVLAFLIGAALFAFTMTTFDQNGHGPGDTELDTTQLKTYDQAVVEPGTNQVNGLANENWFSEELEGETLNFVKENIGNTDFNSTESTDRDQNGAYGAGGADGELEATDDAKVAEEAPGADSEPREVEEADIIKLVDDTLYILNTYRGLIVVDVSTPDEPKIDSRIPLFGYPVEMYIVEPRAYVILTNYYNAFLWTEDASVKPEYRSGSEIVVIDIEDHSNPKVQKYIELDGYITDTRRVGEVIYAVANNYDYYGYSVGMGISIEREDVFVEESWGRSDGNATVEITEEGSEVAIKEDEEIYSDDYYMEPQECTVVVSISMEDLNNIGEVDREWFPGTSNEIHVTEEAIFVAQPEYEYYYDEKFGSENRYYTEVTYVDISDYHGEIKIRDTFKVDGKLEDRYQMDYYDNTFRIVTHFFGEWGELGSSTLWIYDVSNPDNIRKLGDLDIDDAGSLMATRFAGERAYTIHLPYSIDPLDVLDLSDPTNPKLTDILEMPGWVTHMEVRGYKILALGVDDSEGRQKVAVTLFDVTDPENAIMEERITMGEGYSWSSANWDPKALSVIDDQNLILVPFESYSYDKTGNYMAFSGLQIVKFDLEKDDLEEGGVIEQMGSVQRTRANSERIFAISYRTLQVIDASNLKKPKITATLELCNNIVDIVPMGDYSVQVISDYDYKQGNSVTKLRTVSSATPDTSEYLAEKTVEYGIMKLFTNDNYIYLACNDYNPDTYTSEGRILVFDYSDPTSPALKSDFLMEYYKQSYYYYGYYDMYYGYGGGYYNPRGFVTDYNFAQVDGDLIIYHPSPEYNYYYYGPEEDVVYDEKEVYYNETVNGSADGNKTEPEPEPVPREEEKKSEPTKTESTLTEQLYIIDLSNPDKPTDINEITLENTSQISGMYSSGKTLYLIQYEDHSSYDENYRWEYKVKYYLTKIDLSSPTSPEFAGPINIPGGFIGMNDAGTVIYTRESIYDDNYNWYQTLNILELDWDNKEATLTTALELGDNYPSVWIEDTTIFISYNVYSDYYYYGEKYQSTDSSYYGFDGSTFKEPEFKTKIQIIDASAPSDLKLKTSIGLKNYGSIYQIENDKLIIQLSDANGIIVYDISELSEPEFLGYFPIQGWISSIRENPGTGKLFVACGYYGVLTVDIAQ